MSISTKTKLAILLFLLVLPLSLSAQMPTLDTNKETSLFTEDNLTVVEQDSPYSEENLPAYMALVNPFDRKVPLYAQVEALITKENGKQNVLNYEMFTMRDSEIVSVMIHIGEPGGYSNTRMLITVPVEGGFPNAAVMMPFFLLPFRITELSNPLSFFGMDITSEDMNPRNTATDTYRILEIIYAENPNQNDLITTAITASKTDEPLGEIIELVVEGVPNIKSDYARMVYYINTKTMLTMKIEFYDDKNRMVKILEVLKAASPNGIMSATMLRMSDLEKESNTVLTYNELEYNVDVSHFITEMYLKKGIVE